MDLLQELETARQRLLQQVNTEFDMLAEKVRLAELASAHGEEPRPVDVGTVLPLGENTRLFKGTKPLKLIFPDQSQVFVTSWKQGVAEVLRRCLAQPGMEAALRREAGNITGRSRVLLAESAEGMRSPVPLAEGLYMESHFDTETLLSVLTRRILGQIGYDYSGIRVSIRRT